MKACKARSLDHGLYILFWKDGGLSVAAVGSNESGDRWYAPTNWVSVPSYNWKPVKGVKLIITQEGAARHENS